MCEIKHVDFYPTDWLEGTGELNLEQRGLYITACALIYARGEPVTRNHLQRACCVHGRTFNAILGQLLALGKLVEIDGKIGQKRAEKELKNARNRVKKWLKNLDNHEISDTYADRAGGNARAYTPVTTNHHKEDTLEPNGSNGDAAAPPPSDPDPFVADFEILGAVVPYQPDPRKTVFDIGVALFGEKGRSLIGKFRSQYGDAIVMGALIATKDEGPSVPIEFFVKACEARKRGRGNTAHADMLRAFDEVTRH